MSLYLLLANLTAILHGALVTLVVAGFVLSVWGRIFRKPIIAGVFYFALMVIAFSDIFTGECWMTTLEKYLRNLHEPGSAYRNAFLTHYLWFVPRQIITWAGYLVVAGSYLAGLAHLAWSQGKIS